MHKRGKMIRRIITFTGSFLAALSVVAQFFPDAFSFLTEIPNANRLVFVCVIVMLLALFFVNWKQSIDDNENKLLVEHNATHRYAHLLRDSTYEIHKLSSNKANNDSSIHQLLTSFSNGVVSCIADTLYALLKADREKNELSVCIKVLDYSQWNNGLISDKENALYHTISRSYTPKGALQADDAVSHKICECTAFYRIFVEGKHDWTGINLNNQKNTEIISEDILSKGIEYSDSCPNWFEHYTNRIVVPIRVKMSEIDDKYQNSDERNLFGFICVDYSKNTILRISNKFDEDLISVLDLLKTYADTMYVVYDNAYKKMSLARKNKNEVIVR